MSTVFAVNLNFEPEAKPPTGPRGKSKAAFSNAEFKTRLPCRLRTGLNLAWDGLALGVSAWRAFFFEENWRYHKTLVQRFRDRVSVVPLSLLDLTRYTWWYSMI